MEVVMYKIVEDCQWGQIFERRWCVVDEKGNRCGPMLLRREAVLLRDDLNEKDEWSERCRCGHGPEDHALEEITNDELARAECYFREQCGCEWYGEEE
jgi:hypothetical protein